MRKLLSRLFWIPVGLLLVVFLVANRQPVAVSFDPISVEHPAFATPPLPFWVWMIAALLIGFFLGAFGLWASQGDHRKLVRAERRELKTLRREAAARDQAVAADDPPAPPSPSLEGY